MWKRLFDLDSSHDCLQHALNGAWPVVMHLPNMHLEVDSSIMRFCLHVTPEVAEALRQGRFLIQEAICLCRSLPSQTNQEAFQKGEEGLAMASQYLFSFCQPLSVAHAMVHACLKHSSPMAQMPWTPISFQKPLWDFTYWSHLRQGCQAPWLKHQAGHSKLMRFHPTGRYQE